MKAHQNLTSHLWQIFNQIYLDNTEGEELTGTITDTVRLINAVEAKVEIYLDNYNSKSLKDANEVNSAIEEIQDNILEIQDKQVAYLREDGGKRN